MASTNLGESILELCEEDHYGVWELYWKYRNLVGADRADDDVLVREIKALVGNGKIVPLEKNKFNDQFDRVDFDEQRLRTELGKVRGGNVAEDMYWFGQPNA